MEQNSSNRLAHTIQNRSTDDGDGDAYDITLDASYFIQAGFPLLFNIIVLILITTRKKLFEKHSNKLFVNLQAVHIALCITGIIAKFHRCPAIVLLSNGCLIELFLSLILITSDRCYKIKCPFAYELLKMRHVICMIISSWIIAVIFVILCVQFDASGYCRVVISTILLGLASFSLSLSNLSNYIIARRHGTTIHKYIPKSPSSTSTTKVAMKSTYVCFAIVSLFVVSWFPLLIHNVLALAHAYEPRGHKVFTEVAVRMAMLNSFIDPLLFLCFTRDVKKEIRLLVRRYQYNRASQQRGNGAVKWAGQSKQFLETAA